MRKEKNVIHSGRFP
jgi:predicted DNA-binding ribbon-helix-helix protein